MIGTNREIGVRTGVDIASGVRSGRAGDSRLVTLALGFAFAALVLRKGILWPLVLAHWLINLVGFLQGPGSTALALWNVLTVASVTVVLAAYGVYVMLQSNPAKVVPAKVSPV